MGVLAFLSYEDLFVADVKSSWLRDIVMRSIRTSGDMSIFFPNSPI